MLVAAWVAALRVPVPGSLAAADAAAAASAAVAAAEELPNGALLLASSLSEPFWAVEPVVAMRFEPQELVDLAAAEVVDLLHHHHQH